MHREFILISRAFNLILLTMDQMRYHFTLLYGKSIDLRSECSIS